MRNSDATSASGEPVTRENRDPQTLPTSIEPDAADISPGMTERAFARISAAMLDLSGLIIALLALPVCFDIAARTLLGFSLDGMMEIQTLALVLILFFAMGFLSLKGEHIAVDLFYERFSPRWQARLSLFASLTCAAAAGSLAWATGYAGRDWTELTRVLYLPEKYFVYATTFGFACVVMAEAFHLRHILRRMAAGADWIGMAGTALVFLALCGLPWLYRISGIRLDGLVIGALGFALLFLMILLRVPIAFAMCLVGILGMLILRRNPVSTMRAMASLPFRTMTDFVYVAVPMFMLMGELTFRSGMSAALFDCANKWLGRLPGGLACASVAGCAGFGAVCGDSLATAITMSSVALPAMRGHNYAPSLATGCLAAGGTLGILIPPSMGFIFYSLMTEESIGRLFLAGALPGLLLSGIFLGEILFLCRRRPELAPPGEVFSLIEKLRSLGGLVPVALLFVVVVGGILAGTFTPGEGGAVGALGAWIYALSRRALSVGDMVDVIRSTARITAKVFAILVGVALMGALLASSRMPNLLAESIISAGLNRYVFFLAVVVIYMFLGCVMNIIPMMLLTLPALYPSVQALGFDGIWFGVVTVILMEMGMITPPIGMNVFALASLAPDIPMAQIFRGVLPFFLGMLLCVLILTLFPAIATWLPGLLFA